MSAGWDNPYRNTPTSGGSKGKVPPPGGKSASLVTNEKPPKVAPPSKPKPKKVPLPPSLGGPGGFKPTPASVHKFQKDNPAPKKPPAPAKLTPVQQYRARQPRPGGSAQPGLPTDYGNPAKIMNPRDMATLRRISKKATPFTSTIDPSLGLLIGAKPSTIYNTLRKDLAHPVRSVLHNQAPNDPTRALPMWGGRIEKDVAGTAAHFGEGTDALRAALKVSKSLRGKQDVMWSAERRARFAAAQEHLHNQALAPADRVAAWKDAMAGELPRLKVNYKGFDELTPEAVHQMQSDVLNHPTLMDAQRVKGHDALLNVLGGQLPAPHELQILEHVFGKDTVGGLSQIAQHPLRENLLRVANIPRSLMASFDLSAPFRQGIMIATRHPVIFAKNFGPMVKSFGSENVYHAVIDEIHSRPSYPLMMAAKLAISELGKQVGPREERFASDLAEKIPGIGRGVRASGRAYTGYLDKMRADVFDHLIQKAQGQGINVQDEKFLKSVGTYVNAATGRGDLGKFQEAGKVLNAFFFSPRLMAARLNFLNPAFYARLDPFARKEALRSAIQLAGTLSTFIGLASQVKGVKVATDPRNPDWGKIKIGNTRIDMAGGFQQPLRLLAQLATGTAISSTTGKKLNLTAGGFGQPNRLDLLLRFFEGKESPLASLATDKLRNSNQVGQKFSWKTELGQRVIPLLAQDSYDLYKAHHGGVNGLMAAFAGYGVGSVGFGIQTYAPKTPKGSSNYVLSPGGKPSHAPASSSGGWSNPFASP